MLNMMMVQFAIFSSVMMVQLPVQLTSSLLINFPITWLPPALLLAYSFSPHSFIPSPFAHLSGFLASFFPPVFLLPNKVLLLTFLCTPTNCPPYLAFLARFLLFLFSSCEYSPTSFQVTSTIIFFLFFCTLLVHQWLTLVSYYCWIASDAGLTSDIRKSQS